MIQGVVCFRTFRTYDGRGTFCVEGDETGFFLNLMMAAKRKRSAAGKPPEEQKASKRNEKTRLNEVSSAEFPVVQEDIPELPYAEVSELPKIARTYSPDEEIENSRVMMAETSYKNRAPLQADE